jgi:hypothetical protein
VTKRLSSNFVSIAFVNKLELLSSHVHMYVCIYKIHTIVYIYIYMCVCVCVCVCGINCMHASVIHIISSVYAYIGNMYVCVLCVLCVLCVGGLFSVIWGPCKRNAGTPTRMPSHVCMQVHMYVCFTVNAS